MKQFYLLCVMCFFVPVYLFGNIDIECEEYGQYKDIVYDYMLRIEDKIDIYGCDVIPLYAKMIELGKMYSFMDALDENPDLIPRAKEVFLNKNILTLFSKYPVLKQTLFNENTTAVFLNNFSILAKERLNYATKKKILYHPEYFNYFFLAAKAANTPEESLAYYDLLRKSIAVEQLNLFYVYLTATKSKFTFIELLNNIVMLQKKLNQKERDNLIEYPQYIGYLFKDSSVYAAIKLSDTYASVYQAHALELYKSIYKKYRYRKGMDQVQIALKALENISPYLRNQPLVAVEPFRSIMRNLVEKGFIIQLFDQDLCSDKSRDNFAIFGKDNIYNIIMLKQSYPALYEELMNEEDDYRSIFSLFYVANAYGTLPKDQWDVIRTILKELPGTSVYPKIAFVHRLEKLGYFRHIVRRYDYKYYVSVSNEDSSGRSTMKSVYILLTSYPSQNDPSIVERYYSSQFDEGKIKKYLYDLERTPIGELEDHCFTWYEKAEVYMDVAEYTAMAASVVAAPFTGGVSLAYISASIGKKVGTKTLKHMVKASIKKINKNIIKHVQKGSKKVIKTLGKKKAKKLQKSLDKSEEWTDNSSDLFFMGTFLLGDQAIQSKKICEEIK